MKVADFFDIIGGLLTIGLVATVLGKPNTANDIKAAGQTFTGALHEAKA